MGLLGAHVSTAGGVASAWGRAAALGCDALQIFVKNANAWRAKPLAAREIEAFGEARRETRGPFAPPPLPVVAHASYLINLASPDPENLRRSREALADELLRCTALGVDALVVHPGAHMGEGVEAGLAAVARSLDEVFALHPEISARLLLENTAGQGTTLGSTARELGAIVRAVGERQRLGVCLDTCHAFAAGVDLRDPERYRAFVAEVEAETGVGSIRAWHLNDSQGPLGAHKDRHASIGAGELGTGPFERLLHDDRFARTPMLLETPVGDDGLGYARDLATLRALVTSPEASS
jgi:deoxyribonuclease IV